MAGIEDLVDVWRGESKLRSKMDFGKLRGTYYTGQKDFARYIAQGGSQSQGRLIGDLFGKVKHLKIPKKLLEKYGGSTFEVNIKDPKLLKAAKTDILQTIMARAGSLSKLALKGLSVVTSLPAQVVVMTLSPTTANADEVNMTLEDFATLAEEAKPKKEMMAGGGNVLSTDIKDYYRRAWGIGDRVGFQRGTTLASQKSVEEYVNIIRNMIKDNKYVPTANINFKETGPIPNFLKAKEIVKAEVGETFDILYQRNIKKRKDIKRALNPEKKEYDILKKAERKAKRRALKVSDDIKLTAREVKLNFDQRKITRNLNTVIKNNPNLVLKNKALLEQLSFTVSKNGDIIKIKPNLEEIRTRGIVEVEHQRDIFKKGKLKDFPYNRNLILGPYNRQGGFKIMAETFIEKNPDPNNVKVKNIIKKAKELGITLQPDVPKGTFATKSIGYIQEGGPVKKFENAAKHVFKVAKPVLKYALKVVPVVGATVGLADVAKAKEMGLTRPEELATAYYTSPEIAKGWKDMREYDYKDRAAKEWENIQESWKNRETGTEETVDVEDEVMFAKGGIASLKK